MNAKLIVKAMLPAALVLAVSPVGAEEENGGGVSVVGEITPKLYVFDYFDAYGDDQVQFWEQYNWQQGFLGDRRTDFYLDADLNLVISGPERDYFQLERQGFGVYNHRGRLQADTDEFGFRGFYRHFRSGTGGFNYLYNPNAVEGGTDPSYFFPAQTNANSGYVAQFNDDANRSIYTVDRTTFGAGVLIKPPLLGDMASLGVGYDGYRRQGGKFQTYVLGAGDVAQEGTNALIPQRALQRWRGFNQEVDEDMNRVTFKLAASPFDQFQFAYDLALEQFDNQARAYTHADIVFPEGFQYNTDADSTRPLGFVPDSTLITHGIRLSKSFEKVALAAGYGYSSLEQDSFTEPQKVAGYKTGKITTDSAFFNINANLTPLVGVEGFIKYYNRDNDSSYPVEGLIDGATSVDELGVRYNNVESLKYGLSGSFRTKVLKSTITPGWEHINIDRDLTFVTYENGGIRDPRSLLNEKTRSDEIYVKFVSRPKSGTTIRVTPFYQWADETGLVTEPEESYGIRTKGSYMVSDTTSLSGYFDWWQKTNSNNTLTDNVIGAEPNTVTQDLEASYFSAGLMLNLMPTEWVNAYASLSWVRDDFEGYFIRSNQRRFEDVTPASDALLFKLQDRSNYLIDTFVLSLGGDWQASDDLRFDGSYTFSYSNGDTASGVIGSELPEVDGRIDNYIHSLALGAEYQLREDLKLRGSVFLDYYDDNVYSELSGGLVTFMVGVSVAF